MKVSLSVSAVEYLENMIAFYRDEGAAHIGSRFAEEIIEYIKLLAEHPDAGRMVPEFEQPHLREIIHSSFRVVNLRGKNAVKIIRVWRSERLLVLPEK